MYIKLNIQNLPRMQMPMSIYDPELDTIISILDEVCEYLHEFLAQHIEFIVSGFGQEVWPVSLRTDLAVFLEQLPLLLHDVVAGLPTKLDFYEQGVERFLTFTPSEAHYVISCLSWTDWQPNPVIEHIEQVSLQQMLLGVQEAFMDMLHRIAPSLSQHPWVKSWLEGISGY